MDIELREFVFGTCNCGAWYKGLVDTLEASQEIKDILIFQHILTLIQHREVQKAMQSFGALVRAECRQEVLHSIYYKARHLVRDDYEYTARVTLRVIKAAEVYEIRVDPLWLQCLRGIHPFLKLIHSNMEYDVKCALERYPE